MNHHMLEYSIILIGQAGRLLLYSNFLAPLGAVRSEQNIGVLQILLLLHQEQQITNVDPLGSGSQGQATGWSHFGVGVTQLPLLQIPDCLQSCFVGFLMSENLKF